MVRKGCTIWLALAVVIGMAVDGRADLTGAGLVDRSAVSSALSAGGIFEKPSLFFNYRFLTVDAVVESELDPLLTSSFSHFRDEVSFDAEDIKQIPAIPGSAALFFYGLGGLGMYRLGRSAKNLNFGHLPEWYQGNGVRQIGHMFAVDVDLTPLALPVVNFEKTVSDRSEFGSFREESPRLTNQYFLTEVDVHAPPRIS